MYRPILLLILIAGLGACVTTRHTFINPSAERFPRVSPDSVYIVTAESELDTLNYVRVAIIEASGSTEMTNSTNMLNAMRKKAGEVGANAILLPEINEPGAGVRVAAAVLGVETERRGTVVAIRILGKRPPGGQ
jgi:hypothetical protein